MHIQQCLLAPFINCVPHMGWNHEIVRNFLNFMVMKLESSCLQITELVGGSVSLLRQPKCQRCTIHDTVLKSRHGIVKNILFQWNQPLLQVWLFTHLLCSCTLLVLCACWVTPTCQSPTTTSCRHGHCVQTILEWDFKPVCPDQYLAICKCVTWRVTMHYELRVHFC